VSGAAFRVLAVDGVDHNDPAEVRGTAVNLAAGGRIDIGVTAATSPVRISIGGAVSVIAGDGDPPEEQRPPSTLDLLSYGAPASQPFDADQPDRRFTYAINRRPGFLDGRPGLFWTVNGHLFPDATTWWYSAGTAYARPAAPGGRTR
jgi:hypothetical protein